MVKGSVVLMALAMVWVCSLQAAQVQQASTTAPAATQYRSVLDQYCVTCHNEKLKAANLLLDKMDIGNVPVGAEVWEKVIRKLRTGAMPPAGVPRPDKSTINSFASYLEMEIDRAAAAAPNPGALTIHRLNRTEYANAVRDLLGVEVNGDALLPVDDSGYGFDNIGDVLTVSPVLMERYLSAARKVAKLALGDSTKGPTVETYEASDPQTQVDRMSEDFPLGSRGGMDVRHTFPADGEYLIKIRLRRDGGVDAAAADGVVRGVALQRQLDLFLDKLRLQRFTVGGERHGRSTGGVGDCVKGNLVNCQGDPAQEEYERHGVDANLEVRVPVTAGQHVIRTTFLVEDASEREGAFRLEKFVGDPGGGVGTDRKHSEPFVGSVSIRGPYEARGLGESASRSKIFVCQPLGNEESGAPLKVAALTASDGDPCVRKILSNLVRRAYRRPPTSADLQKLLAIYGAGQAEGGVEGGMRLVLERILVGPQFLFRIERNPENLRPGTIYRVSDLDLASRLSFFLWSSIPDDELLGLAENGKLKDPVVLKQQVQRMLRDPRSKAMVSNFSGQWLQLRRVDSLSPDVIEFPRFDTLLRKSFQQETELFLESMVLEDRPLMELLDTNYTFLNERLARHYGIPNVYGSSFRRVTLHDENRRGLLGQGSILSLTSYPTRTSVVLRGVWLLTNILGTPPPPPPPNVPPLNDKSDDGRIKSVRQSMEQHRANAACATCHSRIDPLGFALENFNAIGQWRNTDGADNTAIDSAGALPDGTKFQGPVELRKVLLSRQDQLATTVIEKLLTYALGRGVEYYDEPVVRKILREAAPDYRWASIISGIVNSEPFQMRRTQEQ